MNPIALLAFIAGIGTSNTADKVSTPEKERPAADQSGKQQPALGATKCHRGGWDGN
ncbi:MAG: hypothetical protein ABI599_05995 [Flavobacteriales bacterium]